MDVAKFPPALPGFEAGGFFDALGEIGEAFEREGLHEVEDARDGSDDGDAVAADVFGEFGGDQSRLIVEFGG